jgi:hypothetical protein
MDFEDSFVVVRSRLVGLISPFIVSARDCRREALLADRDRAVDPGGNPRMEFLAPVEGNIGIDGISSVAISASNFFRFSSVISAARTVRSGLVPPDNASTGLVSSLAGSRSSCWVRSGLCSGSSLVGRPSFRREAHGDHPRNPRDPPDSLSRGVVAFELERSLLA